MIGLVLAISAIPASFGPQQRPFDACSLLAKSTIQKVQDEPVTQTKATSQKVGSSIVSQCFYSLPTPAKSISVAVTLHGREIWHKSFHEKSEDKGEEEENEAAKPVPVSGLGDEAYWVHSFVGTLYVLKGDQFLRISIGGKEDNAARLRKARILASDALRHLP